MSSDGSISRINSTWRNLYLLACTLFLPNTKYVLTALPKQILYFKHKKSSRQIGSRKLKREDTWLLWTSLYTKKIIKRKQFKKQTIENIRQDIIAGYEKSLKLYL